MARFFHVGRGLSLLVALGVLAVLVVHAGATGCATQDIRPDPWLAAATVSATPVPTLPVPSASQATAPVPPDPVVNVGFLPASKAGPVFYPTNPTQAAPPQPATP